MFQVIFSSCIKRVLAVLRSCSAGAIYNIYNVRYTGIQAFPNLNRCAKAGRINGRVKLLGSRPIHKTNRVSTRTLENERCKQGLNIYFTTKCTQLGATWSYHSSENNNKADLTYSLEYSGQQNENEAQHSDDAILISRGTILFSTQSMLKNGQIQGSAWPQNDNMQ